MNNLNNWDQAIILFKSEIDLEQADPNKSSFQVLEAVDCALHSLLKGEFSTKREIELEIFKQIFKSGKLSPDTKSTYKFLRRLGSIAERGGLSNDDSWQAMEAAFMILRAIHNLDTENFPDTIGLEKDINIHVKPI